MTSILADIDFQSPLFWAILIGWLISVVLHEFAHGLVAHFGGDYTIRQRGGLTLNPLHYIDPLMSILIPAAMLAMGAVPLPGGVTYIRRDLLRSPYWDSAVSLAGPLMNLLLFFACLIPLHPAIGWVNPASTTPHTNAQVFLATMAVLQMLAVILNLIPVPPLDGFQTISSYLPRDFRMRLSTPPLNLFIFFVYFMILANSPLIDYFLHALVRILLFLGYGPDGALFVVEAYFNAL